MSTDDEMSGDDAVLPSAVPGPQGPDWPSSGGDEGEEPGRCREDRTTLTPKESADCAGAEMAELYENEEDGGS